MNQDQSCRVCHPPGTAPGGLVHASAAAFDEQARAWDAYTRTHLGRLRQELTTRHLMDYVSTMGRSLQVLDAGGGTGSYTLPLAQVGHRVCLLDFSAQMLAIAREKVEQLDPALLERIDFRCAPVQDIPGLFPRDRFDLVLCHTLLEYVPDAQAVLQSLIAVLRPGGVLSLLFVNACADPLRWAFKGDLEQAHLALSASSSTVDLFGLPRRTWTLEEMRDNVSQAGGHVLAEFGIRVLADYVPAERWIDADFFARLLELEAAAGARLPYGSIARYGQLFISRS